MTSQPPKINGSSNNTSEIIRFSGKNPAAPHVATSAANTHLTYTYVRVPTYFQKLQFGRLVYNFNAYFANLNFFETTQNPNI